MLITSMDVDAADEEDFNIWYDREHLAERVAIDGFLEVFNAFNHANFGAYAGHVGTRVGGEVTRNYGAPEQNNNVAYLPRTMQLGFRLTF